MCKVTSKTTASSSSMSGEKTQKKAGKRPGRKPVKIDVNAKLEKSRKSARECRMRKKLRYQYTEELVNYSEKAVSALKEELEKCREWCRDIDKGNMTGGLREKLLSLSEDEIEEMVSDPEEIEDT